MFHVNAFTLYILSAEVFMALTCVDNHLSDRACTNCYTRLCYSGQQYNVPKITVYFASKHCYKQLPSLLLKENSGVFKPGPYIYTFGFLVTKGFGIWSSKQS